jgi:hypothetical protein
MSRSWTVWPCGSGVMSRGGVREQMRGFHDLQLLATVLPVSSPADFLIFSFYPEDGVDIFLRNFG